MKNPKGSYQKYYRLLWMRRKEELSRSGLIPEEIY